MSETITRRTNNIRVKLAPDMSERLESMADKYGMPTATLAAFAIAEWLTGKENGLMLSRMAVLDVCRKVGGQVSEMLNQVVNSPDFDQMIAQSSMALNQVNLPLESDATP